MLSNNLDNSVLNHISLSAIGCIVRKNVKRWFCFDVFIIL